MYLNFYFFNLNFLKSTKTNPVPRPHSSGAINDKNGTNGIKLPSTDLLGLNTASSNQIASSIKSNTSSLNDDDQFDAFVSCAPVLTTTKSSATIKTDNLVNDTNKVIKTNEEEDFFNQKVPEKKILDKESILKLYETSNNLNQTQSNLFNLNTQPLNGGGFNTNPLLISTNGQQIVNPLQQVTNNQANFFQSTTQSTINNGFANFNNQSTNLNQQPFLAFNQTSNPLIATNPFLTPPNNSTINNGTTPTDLFSTINTNLSTTTTTTAKNLETQLNGLNLNNADSFNWPSSSTANGISVGQSLFSANFDNLNTDKKLNGLSTPLTNNISPANPFLNKIQPAIPQQPNNLDILSFNTTNGLNNKVKNDLDNTNWSNFSSSTTNNTLTADIWQ